MPLVTLVSFSTPDPIELSQWSSSMETWIRSWTVIIIETGLYEWWRMAGEVMRLRPSLKGLQTPCWTMTTTTSSRLTGAQGHRPSTTLLLFSASNLLVPLLPPSSTFYSLTASSITVEPIFSVSVWEVKSLSTSLKSDVTCYLICLITAHVCGHIGKNVRNGRVAAIIGLDPAGPLFSVSNPTNRLDAGDAVYVEAIHTNGPTLLIAGAGIGAPIAHADFFPNGGRSQPGCILNACSHDRAVDFYRKFFLKPSADLFDIFRHQSKQSSEMDSTRCDAPTLMLLEVETAQVPPKFGSVLNLPTLLWHHAEFSGSALTACHPSPKGKSDHNSILRNKIEKLSATPWLFSDYGFLLEF